MSERALFVPALCAAAALSLSALFAGEEAKPSQSPLLKADACSVLIAPDLTPKPGYFPLGILADRKFSLLAEMGYNFTDSTHCCYEFREGKPCSFDPNESSNGLHFAPCWAAHTLYRSLETANYGELKSALKENGEPVGRQWIRYLDPQTRKYVLDCEAATVRSMSSKPGLNIFLWGIDNEWECPLDYSPEAKAAFGKWLEKAYSGDLAKLDAAWGGKFASFAEAGERPPGTKEFKDRQGAWLDWRRFQEEAYTDFVAERFKTINEADPLHRPAISKSTQCTIEMPAVARKKANNHETLAAKTRESGQGWYGIDMYGHGDRNCYELSYLYNCARPLDPASSKWPARVFAAETNNHAGPAWQFAESYWRAIANGLKGVNFFCMGYFGAKNDWATFAMTNPLDGSRYGRFYYAARLGAMIHRSESFWSEASPKGFPKAALLVPFLDVSLSEAGGPSLWDYSMNNRLNVFKWLRDQGYWVEAIPYSKLAPDFLKNYQALFLVGAEHLSKADCENVKSFVSRGGLLVSDSRPGVFDEHHAPSNGLDELLGVQLGDLDPGIDYSPDDVWYKTPEERMLRVDGKVKAKLTSGTLVNAAYVASNAKAAWLVENAFGEGKSLWFNTRLGVLRAEQSSDLAVSAWLAGLLKERGFLPGVSSSAPAATLRVEEPLYDAVGNCALVVSSNVQEPLKPFTLNVAMKEGDASRAFWASAESTSFEPLDDAKLLPDGRLELKMPELRSAGVVYLFKSGAPFLGLAPEGSFEKSPSDPWTPFLAPGSKLKFKLRIANPGVKTSPKGTISLLAPEGWALSKSSIEVSKLSPGELEDFKLEVSVPERSSAFLPNKLYSVVARWKGDDGSEAVAHSPVELKLDKSEYPVLLSDNPGAHEEQRFFVKRTGATYEYSFPAELKKGQELSDPSNNKGAGKTGSALQAGLKQWDRQAWFKGVPELDVTFDLKDVYALSSVVVTKGQSGAAPKGLSLFAGEDPAKLSPLGSPELAWKGDELELPLKDVKARYLKLRLSYPKEGGFLDEVEIYGKELSKR